MRVLCALLLLAVQWASAEVPAEKTTLPAPEPRMQRQEPGPATIAVIAYGGAVNERDILTQAVPELLRFIGESTDLATPLTWARMPLDDPRVPQALMLYLTGQDGQMRLDEVERKALGDFIRGGGLVFAEEVVPTGSGGVGLGNGGLEGTPFDRQLKALIRDPLVLGSQSPPWQRIPNNHPLYSCYFDMPGGPPLSGANAGNVRYLEGLEHRGRLAVIFSDLNFSSYWATTDAEGRDSSMRLGTNVVVLALTYRLAGRPLPTRR